MRKLLAVMAVLILPATAQADELPFGVYAGGHVGWSRAVRDAQLPAPFLPGEYTEDSNGVAGGALAGIATRISWLVIGAEFDVTLGGGNPRQTVDMPASAIAWHTYASIDATATARLRMGFARGPWLLYGTGGVAWMRGSADLVITDGPATLSTESTRVDHWGWVAGGGIGMSVTESWAIRAEYLHYDFGSQTYAFGPDVTSAKLRIDTIRLAVIYSIY
jgi:opacity protein-like surface antigen